MNRRRFLTGVGCASLAVPFLGRLRPARAGALSGPKRLVVVHHQQGVVMNRWAPTGTESSFSLPTITAPLAPFQDRMVVVAGLDNKIPGFNSAGNGHENANVTLLTAMPFQDQSAAVLTAAGPSIEQVIADRISTTTPFKRLDFGVGGGTSGGGLATSPFFFAGAGDPISVTNDPTRAFATVFGGTELSAEELAALQGRRGSVLDAVQQNFAALRGRLDESDRARLDAHAEKVAELEARVTSPGALGCAPPTLSLPGDYDYGFDDDTTSPVMIDLLVEALACDQTRVSTLSFLTGHDPTFPWLDVDGAPLVDTSVYDNWHGMVHDGRDEEGLVVGFNWYAQIVVQLLAAMDARVDVDGDNLLDSSLVMWISEFGNGAGHNTLKIPVMLFGNLGGADLGRFVDHMNGGPDDDWSASEHTTNQLYVSLLQLFGGADTTFGLTDASLPTGPLPGLL